MKSVGVLPEDYFFDLQKILENRYSCQEFNSDIIDDDLDGDYLALVNDSPFRVVVVSNKKIQSLLHKFSFLQKQIVTCSHLFVFCSMKKIDSNINYIRLNLRYYR